MLQQGHRLLEAGENSRGPESPPSLRRLAIEAGFGTGRRVIKIDQRALAGEFIDRDSDVVRLWPWLANITRAQQLDWIQRHTLQTDGNSATTFTYAILKTFLARKRDGPIGGVAGPPQDWSEIAFEPRLIERSRNAQGRSEENLAQEASAAAREVMRREPPVRVTYSEIIRQARSIQQAIRSGSFPNLRQMVEQVTEDVRAFQLRRVAWLIGQRQASGEQPSLTWVRQRSGIPNLNLVRQLMQEAMEMVGDGSADD